MLLSCFPQVKHASSTVPKGLTPLLDPNDPFADDEKERREVEEMAKKFESKYVSVISLKTCLRLCIVAIVTAWMLYKQRHV